MLMKTRLREFAHNHMLSRSDQHLSCSGRVQLPQNSIAEVPANSRGAVHRLRRHAYKQREPVSRVSRQMDMMMAAERRRAEEELLQPVHAACLALPVVQAPPRPGERAAARRDRFRRRHGERWGCRRAWIASERVRVRSAGCG